MTQTQREPLTMPLEEAMRTQRVIRRVKSDPVDDALILHLLELAMKAPTGSNAQNWEFIVVKDRAVVAKLARLNRRALAVGAGIYKRIATRRSGGQNEQMLRIEKAVRWQAEHFEEIPVVVVACLKGWCPGGRRSPRAVPTAPSIPRCRTCCSRRGLPGWVRR